MLWNDIEKQRINWNDIQMGVNTIHSRVADKIKKVKRNFHLFCPKSTINLTY